MPGGSVSLNLIVSASVGAAHGALQSLGAAVTRLQAQAKAAQGPHKALGDQIARLRTFGAPVEDLRRRYDALGRTIEQTRRQAARLDQVQERIGQHRAAMGELWGQAVGVGGAALAFAAPVKAAIGFESAMADVKKVVDGTDAQLAALGTSIAGMSRTIPLAATDLADLAAAGGQLGVALDDLPAFVTTTAKMAVAFDMDAGEAGDAMAKLANVYQIPIGAIGGLGDVVNQLSNESPAKAGDIVRALSRVGGVARQFGLSAEGAAALSSALISLGKPPEVAGTAINAMLTKLSTADRQGRAFQDALAGIGMTAEGLKQAIAVDAQGAITGFLGALGQVPQADRTGLLVDLFGLEYADDIAVLAGSVESYKAALAIVPRSGGSMEKEFSARAATTANNLQLLKNNVMELGINLGSALLPALNDVLGAVRPLVTGLADFARAHPALVGGLGKLAAALLVFKAGSLAARAGYHWLASGLLGAQGRIMALRGAWLSLSLALQTRGVAAAAGGSALFTRLREIANSGSPIRALGFHLSGVTRFIRSALVATRAFSVALLTTPIGWIGLAVAGAALLIYKFWKPIAGFFRGLWQGLKAGLKPLEPAFAVFKKFAPWLFPVLIPLRMVRTALGWVGRGIKALFGPIEDVGGRAEAMGKRFGAALAGVVNFATAIPSRMYTAGANIVKSLWDGMKSLASKPVEAMKSIAGKIREYLPFSPAKVGPLRDIHRVRLVETIAEGMKPAPMVRAMKTATAATALALSLAAPAAAPALPRLPALPPVPTAELAITAALPQARPLPPVPTAPGTIGGRADGAVRGTAAPGIIGGRADGAVRGTAAPSVVFAPNITITGGGQGGASGGVKEQVEQALALSFEEFARLMDRYQKQQQRRSFA